MTQATSRETGTREAPLIEAKVGNRRLSAPASLRLHWPEYLMEAGETSVYLFSACVVATLLWHPHSPVHRYIANDAIRRVWMGLIMAATMIAIVLSPWGKESGAHINPAVTLAFYRLGKVGAWDATFYCGTQLVGAVAGVALASLALQGAPADKAVRYAATLPANHGEIIAFAAELVISFILMSAVLFTSNHKVLAAYTHHFAAMLIGTYIAFESPLSGMSTNPARTFGPAFCGGYWHALWISFIAPPLGMLTAAQMFLLNRRHNGSFCAKLHHHNDKRCIFCRSGFDLPVPLGEKA